MASRKDSQTYRATFESWIGQFFLPFLFMGLGVVTLVNLANLHPGLGGVGLLALLVVGLYDYALPMLLNWLKLEAEGVICSINGRRLQVYWTEVLAVWMIRRGRHPFLCLGTHQGTAMIPLRFLDTQAVWKGVRARVNPAALETSAFQRLPDYRQWANTRDSLVTRETAPRQVVDHWIVQVAGWGSLGFSVLASLDAINSGSPAIAWLFVPLGVLSILWIMNWGITEFDHEGVRRRTLLGSWRIRWDELERVEIDPMETLLVLEGGKKRLVISGPALWIRSGLREALTMLQAQCEHRGIPIRHSLRALLKLSRNMRVKSR